MSDTNIDLSAFQRLEESLRLAPEIYEQEFTTAMQESVDLLHSMVTEYPPQPPPRNPRRRPYIRTFTLKASWQKLVEVAASVISGRVFTDLNYAGFVQDAERQSRYLTYWRVVQQIVADAKPEIFFNFREAVTRGSNRMKGQ